MKSQTIYRLAPLAAAVMVTIPFITGCEPVKPPITARQDPYSRDQIHLTSDELKYHTAVDAPHVWRDDGGLLHVTLPIRATTNHQLNIDYRATFLDRDGLPISQSGW